MFVDLVVVVVVVVVVFSFDGFFCDDLERQRRVFYPTSEWPPVQTPNT